METFRRFGPDYDQRRSVDVRVFAGSTTIRPTEVLLVADLRSGPATAILPRIALVQLGAPYVVKLLPFIGVQNQLTITQNPSDLPAQLLDGLADTLELGIATTPSITLFAFADSVTQGRLWGFAL